MRTWRCGWICPRSYFLRRGAAKSGVLQAITPRELVHKRNSTTNAMSLRTSRRRASGFNIARQALQAVAIELGVDPVNAEDDFLPSQ